MKSKRGSILCVMLSSFAWLAPIDAAAAPPVRDRCGDTAGPNGRDVRCSCGDTVITNTILQNKDPVARTACPADGLIIASGIVLDLNGKMLTGQGGGRGITIGEGGTVQNGAIRGFGVGVAALGGSITLAALQVSDSQGIGLEVHGGLTAHDVEVANGASHGILVDTAEGVLLLNVNVHDNQGNGVYVLRAEGAPIDPVFANASFVMRSAGLARNSVSGNQGDGIVLGDLTAQTGVVNAQVRDTEIVANGATPNPGTDLGGAGLRIEEKDAGAASTHWFVAYNNIYDNRGKGVHLRPSFPLPIFAVDRKAFVGNLIHHNGQPNNPSCLKGGGPENDNLQLAPQIWVEGAPPFVDPACPCRGVGDPECALGPQTQGECVDETDPVSSSDGVAHWCVWNQGSGQCRTAYPMNGTCDTGTPNAVYNYTGTGRQLPLTVGLYVSDGAAVDARGNKWEFGGRELEDWFIAGDVDDVLSAYSCSAPPAVCP